MGNDQSCSDSWPNHYGDQYDLGTCGTFELTTYPYKISSDTCSGTNYNTTNITCTYSGKPTPSNPHQIHFDLMLLHWCCMIASLAYSYFGPFVAIIVAILVGWLLWRGECNKRPAGERVAIWITIAVWSWAPFWLSYAKFKEVKTISIKLNQPNNTTWHADDGWCDICIILCIQ
jgi:hypothetical protein